jgi:serine/threonine protein phosphatase PrpC
MHWQSAALTDPGLIRQVNEDAFLENPDAGVWAVADGMGGHSAGDLASEMIVTALARLKPAPDLSTLVEFAEHQIILVNERLQSISRERRQVIGSTVVSMVACGEHAAFLWAGDSRLYRLRDGVLERLTIDHSKVEEYVRHGIITREEAQNHPDGNLITRAVGAAENLFLECNMVELAVGDRFLLCSDGLDKHVIDRDIATALSGQELQATCKKLVHLALEGGGTDNVTVCLIEIVP